MANEELHLSDWHLSDEEMLAVSDGELPASRVAHVHAHLSACWSCRARMAEIEQTILDFARAQREALDLQLPPIAGPRALLKAQLAELSAKRETPGRWFLRFPSAMRATAFASVGIFIVAAGILFFQRSVSRQTNPTVAVSERGLVPDRSLTPGATRMVKISDVCAMPHEEAIAEVSPSLREEVLQEYGIVNFHPADYEIDYLIAPGLGGVEEIHNLWPEPYSTSAWNAHVKDELEEHLHQLVCAGTLDLSTAQRDIATDWIAAYKKYFHTEKPLSLRSHLDLDTHLGGEASDSASHFAE
jgi:hypothetical protein